MIVKNETMDVEYLILYFFFSYSRKFPLRIYRSKIRFRIIYNAWENHAFFDAILFDSWNFWNLLTSIFFPSTIFYLDRIFAIDMTGRVIRIYKRWYKHGIAEFYHRLCRRVSQIFQNYFWRYYHTFEFRSLKQSAQKAGPRKYHHPVNM